MISRVREAILEGGGYILDLHMFSNAAICINFAVAVGDIGKFYTSLAATGLRLDQESHDLLEGSSQRLGELGEAAKAAEVMGALNIAFIHDEPDLRIELPPIPG